MAFKPVNDRSQGELVKLEDGEEFHGYFAGGPRTVETKKGPASVLDFISAEGAQQSMFANKSLLDEMSGAVIGRSTLIRREGKVKTKRGNDFVVYRAMQDDEDNIEIASSSTLEDKQLGA